MTTNILPPLFLQRFSSIIPTEVLYQGKDPFSFANPLTIRINTLKSARSDVKAAIEQEAGCSLTPVDWEPTAYVIRDEKARPLLEPWIKKGEIYIQSLSSMLPVTVLDPQPQEEVLDLCAAPGSKTSFMAQKMNNQGRIVAVETVKNRFYKLKSVLNILGVDNAEVKLMDGRRYRPQGILFDKILVDAPCSSEGRFKTSDKDSCAYWSLRKIREMAHKQKGLLLSASRLLKPEGTLLYSTCTFAPEENEEVIDWFLRKAEGIFQVEPVHVPGVENYPAVEEWDGKRMNPQVAGCFRVLPTDLMEGFFIAKLIKKR